jgi:anti-sigma factor ChrR (cupin superfamily)
MLINADLDQPVTIATGALDWAASPLPGVERRMLERIGGEVARATSLVRYAPGSAFSAHTHGGGEEYLVLDGVFHDEHGDFGKGFYIRNPPGSRHTPSSPAGCTILVKLWQMHTDDQTPRAIDTGDGTLWTEEGNGVRRLPLHEFGEETVDLLELPAGATLGPSEEPGGLELFVLAGTIEVDGETWPAETWLRRPPGAVFSAATTAGCRLYRKRGHLTAPPPLPEPAA